MSSLTDAGKMEQCYKRQEFQPVKQIQKIMQIQKIKLHLKEVIVPHEGKTWKFTKNNIPAAEMHLVDL